MSHLTSAYAKSRYIFTRLQPLKLSSGSRIRCAATIATPLLETKSDGRTILALAAMNANAPLTTRIVPVAASEIGSVISQTSPWIEDWSLELSDSASALHLRDAARQIRETDVPVAFPTETVYGLGADATRDSAVKSIFRVKGRPSDNPLIVHFASIQQIRDLLQDLASKSDPIPSIYKSLIERFWPGPLTILLPLPEPSPLAPSVTVGLKTFGARIPRNPVALALLRLANVPVAAPSANASTRPSPTAAEHVAHDLDGRISLVLDGGPCDVGVESTVVDGLCSPPAILRPGGVSVEQLRQCEGWENVRTAYANQAEDKSAPRAPGMKYRHYSPKAKVILFEACQAPSWNDVQEAGGNVAFVMTKTWRHSSLFASTRSTEAVYSNGSQSTPIERLSAAKTIFSSLLQNLTPIPNAYTVLLTNTETDETQLAWTINLGSDIHDIARGIFSALRELDGKDVDTIFVEGIDENDGDVAIAVMNRLRKAAEVKFP